MTLKQRGLTGAAVLLLLGVPVYQQTRIIALQDKLAALHDAAATNSRKVVSRVVAAASDHQGPSTRSAGSPSEKARSTTDGSPPNETNANTPQDVVSRVNLPGPGEAVFKRRGSGVVLDSFRAAGGPAATPGISGDSVATPDASGLDALTEAPRTTAGHVQWDHAQATGAPDTREAGDRPTAWAPRSPRSGEQWLQLGYDKPVEIREVNIHESYNSGAVSKVTALQPNGTEKMLWSGNATPGAANEILETALPVPPGTTSDQIRIYVDTNRVASWPEIDAVELVGADGSRQWAARSSASSSYSELYSNQETLGLESTLRSYGSGAEATVLPLGGGNPRLTRPASGP